MSSSGSNTGVQTLPPLVNCIVNDALLHVSPHVNQTSLQVVHILDLDRFAVGGSAVDSTFFDEEDEADKVKVNTVIQSQTSKSSLVQVQVQVLGLRIHVITWKSPRQVLSCSQSDNETVSL